MTTRAKIAVSLPVEMVERAQRAVAGAMAQNAKLDDLASLLDEILARRVDADGARARRSRPGARAVTADEDDLRRLDPSLDVVLI